MLTTTNPKIDLDLLEPYLLAQGTPMPCHVVHHFGPGVYVREVTLPKGIMAMGHKQRFEHLNVVLKGSVAIYDEDGVKVIKAPTIFVGKPGRKFGVCLEECVWQNIYPNPDNERDIEKLEERFAEKSEYAQEYFDRLLKIQTTNRQNERDDYAKFLTEIGYTESQARNEVETISEVIDIPVEYAANVSVRNSPIEGRGLFLSSSVKQGAFIAPARIGDKRTSAGRYVNHSPAPNCEYKTVAGDLWLVALRDINGSIAGTFGEELTVNYRDAMKHAVRKELK